MSSADEPSVQRLSAIRDVAVPEGGNEGEGASQSDGNAAAGKQAESAAEGQGDAAKSMALSASMTEMREQMLRDAERRMATKAAGKRAVTAEPAVAAVDAPTEVTEVATDASLDAAASAAQPEARTGVAAMSEGSAPAATPAVDGTVLPPTPAEGRTLRPCAHWNQLSRAVCGDSSDSARCAGGANAGVELLPFARPPAVQVGTVMPLADAADEDLPTAHTVPPPMARLLEQRDTESEDDHLERQSRVLRRVLGKKAAKQLKIDSLQQAAAVASLVEWGRKYRWRSDCEFWSRVALAWTFNIFIYIVASIASLTYGVVKFQGAATNYMLVGWGIAAVQIYIVLEPLQILIIVFAPWLFNEDTNCGRCCGRVRFWYNELFAP